MWSTVSKAAEIQKVRAVTDPLAILKEIGKEINLNIFENIQRVVMNADTNTTQQALLCAIHSFLSPL